MAGEWRTVAVGDIAAPERNALVGGPFGSNLVSRDYVEAGVPVIRGENMGERWVSGDFAYVTEGKARSLAGNLARPGDVVFTQRGTLGQVALVLEDPFDCYLVSQSQMKLTVDRTKADPLFYYYVFSSSEQRDYIRRNAIQTGVPHTNLGILRDTPVPLPSLSEQRAIADILGTLDDKIELNRRMNETLEAMARALFKSWFVDFDPVRAKAEDQDPALPKEIADLFPDSFEDSELGKIPKGWRVGSLRELFGDDKTCVLTGPFGSNLHAHDYRKEGVPLILVKHVVDGQILEEDLPLVGDHKLRDLERYRLRIGDIVFTRVGAVGRSAYVRARQAGWLISGQMLRVRVPEWKVLHPRYLAQVFLEKTFMDMVEGYALGTTRFLGVVRELSQAFALAVPHAEALRIRDDVAFFQAVRAVLAKRAPGEQRTEEELDLAVRQIVSRAVASEGVVDIFAAAGLKKPDLSILSEEFLAEVRGMPQRNLAVELLRKLLSGEIQTRRRKNVVQARSFAEMLEQAIRRYQNRAIEAAQVIEELIGLAKEMRQAHARGESLGLTEDELAFYDALETNDSAVKVLGDETLRAIARELVATVRANVTIDWTVRENVRAQLRVLVKRILRKHGYPPDKQEKATQTVLEQAEVLSELWAAA